MRQAEFLARVRDALKQPQAEFLHAPSAEMREWNPLAELAGNYDALAVVFERELVAVNGFVHRVESDDEARARMLQLVHGAKMVGVDESARAFGVESALASANIALASSRAELEQADAGVSGAVCAIAETGTLVVASGFGEARLVSLLPRKHIALVRAQQLVPNVMTALRVVREKFGENFPANITFITGPSRTADIELSLSIGVHGPGEVHVILVRDTDAHS